LQGTPDTLDSSTVSLEGEAPPSLTTPMSF
jgi:hypothetical protein